MRRWIALMLALLLPACALSEGLTLKTVSTFAGSDAAADTYTKLLRGWEDETGNRVLDASAPSDEDWKKGVLLDFATGNEADVLFFFTGTADSAPILKRVMPIETINAEYPALNLPESDACRESDGLVYAIPVREYWEGLFCNVDLFVKYDLELPDTWEKLETAIKTFRKHGVVPISVSLSDVPHYIAEFCILSCEKEGEHPVRPLKGDPAPQSWLEGMALLRRLYELDAFPDNVNSTTESESSRLFTSKQAAMQLDGSWFANGLPLENMDSTVVLPFPSYAGGKGVLLRGVSMGFYLTKKAWNDEGRRAAAVSLLSYLTTGENALALGDYTYSGLLKHSAQAMLQADATAQQPFQDDMDQAARNLWFSAIPAIAEGRTDPATVFEQVIALSPFQ